MRPQRREQVSSVLKKAAEKDTSVGFQQEAIDESQQLELDRQRSELDLLSIQFDGIHDELIRDTSIHKWRKWGLIALFALVVIWLGVICLFLFLSGYEPGSSPVLQLSDAVIIALIGSTTVNVIGLFYLAARWLYSTPKSEKRNNNKP